MEHGIEFKVVSLICIALFLGAVLRWLSNRIRIPYTIAVLILGLVAGLTLQGTAIGDLFPTHLPPHLIIFIFLPALIFESAYSLDVHTFARNLGTIALLALPALVISTLATAALMVGVTSLVSWTWTWPAALVFGALISATDPVAVVAILRELGAPKRLGLLIEGESLLNDGTAIVIFGVLLGLLTGAGHELSAGSILFEFLKVVSGGLIVGLTLGVVATAWLSRTFNDALVEITLTLIVAYGAMIVAEGLLHVSGVIAIVVAGLYISGPGRTRISPEIREFLHQFWEMIGYIANTLIFFLVGCVVALQIQGASLWDLLPVLLAYVGIVLIRFVVTFLFLPLMNRVGEEVTRAEATVMAWGGLRGAVSLALALIVSQTTSIGFAIREEILLATAGVAFLTILINGSTTEWLLSYLKLDQPPLTERLARLTAGVTVLDHVEDEVTLLSTTRTLRSVSWETVHSDLRDRRQALEEDIEEIRQSLEAADPSERATGYWRQVLGIERKAYWEAFNQGILSGEATRILDHEITLQIDRLTTGDIDPPETREPPHQFGLRGWALERLRSLGLPTRSLEFGRLSLEYELARAENQGAETVLHELEDLDEMDRDVRSSVRNTYRRYLHRAKERLEAMRVHMPEISRAIEQRLAERIELNLERQELEEMVENGALEEQAAEEMLASLQSRMKALHFSETTVSLPKTTELCRNTPLFSRLDETLIDELAEVVTERVYSSGDPLFSEGDSGDGLYIIARGAVEVFHPAGDDREEEILDILGGGEILGEMALLTGEPRTASARARTPVTVGFLEKEAFDGLMKKHSHLADEVWEAFCERELDNHLRTRPAFRHMSHHERLDWANQGKRVQLAEGETLSEEEGAAVFLAVGSLKKGEQTWSAPTLVSNEQVLGAEATEAPTVLLLLPPPEALDILG